MGELNIMPTLPLSIMPSTAAPIPKRDRDEDIREFGDPLRMRQAVYDRAMDAFTNLEPVSNRTHTLRLSGLEWGDPGEYTRKQHKEAILAGRSLNRRLRGTWHLSDNETGETVDQRSMVVARIPHVSDNNTFIHKGNEYSLKNQQRLRSGIYTRIKDNGEVEAHANILRNGPSHRYFLDPDKGVFFMRIGQSKIPLMPLLKAMGAQDEELREAWGKELHAVNYPHNDGLSLQKLQDRILKPKDIEAADGNKTEALVKAFERMELDPEVTSRTLGVPYRNLNKESILATTKKLLAISRGEAEVDDRDHLAYQTFHGPEDLISERVARDRGGLRRQLLFRAAMQGHLKRMPSSAMQSQVEAALLESGLGQALEEINPAEVLDKQTQISRLGEGGIPSLQAVPEEARNVQPSHFGFMDPLRTPESFKVGVDVHMARNARKGRDGQIYSRFQDARTGKSQWYTPQEVSDRTIAFSGTMDSKAARVPAMRQGRMQWVPKDDVDLVLSKFENAFSPLGNMIPLKSMVKGQRVAMASRMLTQALPLAKPEAPLVQSGVPGTDGQLSFETDYAKHMGALRATKPGRVVSVSPDGIKVAYQDGERETLELFNNHPYNRKTYLNQTSALKMGDRFMPGDLLASSNFTNETGDTALGLNARVAYLPWGGKNFEDAIVISEGMAKRLTSEHMYQHDLDKTDRTRTGKSSYVSLFPGKYNKDTLAKLDDEGVIQVGATVSFGDPLILAANQKDRALNKIHRKRQAGFNDATVTWDHHDDGIVTDVSKGKRPVVLVKSSQPMKVGDKLSGRYGDKGVIGAIISDSQMPHDKDGVPYEVLLNPLGVISRTNPAQMVEAALGKLAVHQGKPFIVEDFPDDKRDMTEWAEKLLRQAGLRDQEDIVDPSTDRKIAGIKTGNRFFMKLHHTAETKGKGRGSGGYTAEDAPARGGETGSKRVSLLDVNALLSHGATEVVRDASVVRGQRNDDYWLQFMQGNTPRQPKIPTVYTKFIEELKGAGINVVRDGSQLNIMALTNDDVDEMVGDRIIQNGETVQFDQDLKPVPGGLFDPSLTGGHHGKRWAAVQLPEPMPNPAMEEPIRRMLDLTKKGFMDVIAGREEIAGFGTGPGAIGKALENINVDRDIAIARAHVKDGSKANRDKAVKKLGYLKSAKELGVYPHQWMLDKVPVLPPQFRPVNVIGDKDIPLVADPNFLYKELLEANSNLNDMRQHVDADSIGDERLAVYSAFKAVTGLGDPITKESKEKNIRGILKGIFGSSPKFGTVQRKLISSTVDNVGRAVITPNPDLDMDSVGLPEDRAFEVYKRFIVRRLKRKGMQMTQAMRHVKDKTPLARQVLIEEMDHRPVIVNRAPVLHRYGILAFKPQLTAGSTVQVSPLIVKGFNADFDGDAINYNVPTDEEARKEALDKMLPSRQLLSVSDFKTPMHMPGQEYVGGLYMASSAKSKRSVRTFSSKADVMKAWRRGEISVDDRVKILD